MKKEERKWTTILIVVAIRIILIINQKDSEDLIKYDNYNSLNKEKKEMIKNNLKAIEKYFENEDKTNFHCFALVAYNLKRLLFIKEVRKS